MVRAEAASDAVVGELARALGKDPASMPRIRKTHETPPRISVVDVAMAVTGKNSRHAAEAVRTVVQAHPEVDEKIVHFPEERFEWLPIKVAHSGVRESGSTGAARRAL
jgi:hypothetical protein